MFERLALLSIVLLFMGCVPVPASNGRGANRGPNQSQVEAAKVHLRDNTNDPSKLEIVRIREGTFRAIPMGAWASPDAGITSYDVVEWQDTAQWNGSPFVWIKFRDANEIGAVVIRDKTFIFTTKGMLVTEFPSEDIWRSEKVTKVISPEQSDAIQSAGNRMLRDLFSPLKNPQEELKQLKK
jgi:hypothetical protein